jgi:hypothetical protein
LRDQQFVDQPFVLAARAGRRQGAVALVILLLVKGQARGPYLNKGTRSGLDGTREWWGSWDY